MRNPILDICFYQTDTLNEPVREWLQQLTAGDKKIIGEDLKTIQFGWPLGMPLVKHVEGDIWESRSKLKNGIARIFFVLDGKSMILIHGFQKKQQRTPKPDLDLARTRIKKLRKQ